MSATPRVSLCILCHDRPEDLHRALASADGFDEVVVLDMASEPPLVPQAGVRWLRNETNTGVAAGRNQLVAATEAEIVVFLDDDATFTSRDAAGAIRTAFATPERPVALAFKVVRPSGDVESSEFPFRGRPRDIPRAPCGYFVGCGVAVTRDAFERAGGFDDRYVYSTEEIDLALSLQRDDGALSYEPGIVVCHAPSPRGRGPATHVPALRLRNRLLLVRRHFPIVVAGVHVGAWSGRTLVEAIRAGGLREWCGAWRNGLRLPIERRPLRYRQLRRIHRRGGRVWW